MKSASETKCQGANWRGFPPLAKPTGGKPKFDVRTVVLDSRTMSSFCSLSSYSTFYPGFWYLTNVVACIKYVPYIFHYRLYAPLAILWQEKGCLSVTPPSLLIRQQKVNKMNYEIRGTSDDVCPWGTAGRNINTCHATA